MSKQPFTKKDVMKVLVVLASLMSAAILPACAQTVNNGGQYMAYTPLEDSLQEYTQRADDGYQRWFFTLQSAGVFQICNLQDAADGDYFSCLSDQSGTVSFGYAPDNWTVAASGDGFTFQNVRTGKYLQDPSTENGIITTSSTPSVWTIATPE
jgi:hypothetical protein